MPPFPFNYYCFGYFMVTQSIWQLFNSHADHEPLSLSSTKWWTTTIHSSAQELIRVVILPNCDCRTEPNVLFVITIRDNNIISQHLRHFARPEQLRESQSWTRQTRSRSTSIKDKGHYVTPLELLHISYSSSNINGLKGDLCCVSFKKWRILWLMFLGRIRRQQNKSIITMY